MGCSMEAGWATGVGCSAGAGCGAGAVLDLCARLGLGLTTHWARVGFGRHEPVCLGLWNDMVWVVALVPWTSPRVVAVVATVVVAMVEPQ